MSAKDDAIAIVEASRRQVVGLIDEASVAHQERCADVLAWLRTTPDPEWHADDLGWHCSVSPGDTCTALASWVRGDPNDKRWDGVAACNDHVPWDYPTADTAAAARLRSLAAIYEQPLNRDQSFTFTGRELAAMLKEEG